MKWEKTIRASILATLLTVLMLFSSFPVMTAGLTSEQRATSLKNEGTIAPLSNGDMTFTSGDTINFTTTETMEFSTGNIIDIWSGVTMNFTSTVKMDFIELTPDGVLQPCDDLLVIFPGGYLPDQCSWWEVLDASGKGIGEFHVDYTILPDIFHIDIVWPGPIQVPIGAPIRAVRKIDVIEPCTYFEVHWPPDWWPEPCTWWELIDPETGVLTGVEFHIDWTNSSCEFHVDEVLIDGVSGRYTLPFPWYMLKARQKIPTVEPCDYLEVEHPTDWWPDPCTWWEILDFETGERTGYEFHIDWTNESCEIHVDEIWPPTDPYVFPWPGVPGFHAEEKVVDITECSWFWLEDPQFVLDPCTWWEILDPSGAPTGIEFHIDDVSVQWFHIDQVLPSDTALPWGPSPTVTVRRKVEWIEPCRWYIVDDPASTPEPCSWWRIIDPDVGDIEFHVDDSVGDVFHIDIVLPTTTRINPTHLVTAERKIDDIQPCDWFKVVDPIAFLPQPCSFWEITYPPEWAGTIFHVDTNDGRDMFHIDDVTGLGQPPTVPPWNVTATPYEEPPPPWYKKPPYPDYAPSGVPDFDQKQNGWFHPQVGWSWCGPVSVANSVWWLDSEFETNVIPPPVIIDNFPLVTAYGPWDDHDVKNVDPLVHDLAWWMDTDGIRTGLQHSGTWWWDMQWGLEQYLIQQGVQDLFEVHSMEFPDFYWIAEEIYICQDVVLLLEFWEEGTGERWIYEPGGDGGHYVTCAGVNITMEELLVSDPWTDNAEAGGPGDVPVAHPYPHGVDIHNDTQFVSHDAYTAAINPFFGVWELLGFLQGPAYGFPPTWHALITAAVVTSPIPGEHDVAVIDVTASKTGCTPAETIGKGYPAEINATAENQGDYIETFNVTIYADATPVGSQQVTLNPTQTQVLTYTWDTTTYPYGNYTITAVADIVPGEIDVADNTYNYGWIVVTIAGDMDGDGDVDIFDIVIIASAYGTRRGDPGYNPNADIDDDGDVDIFDVVIAAGNYGTSIPP